jgi:hypothetical protein
MPRKSRMEIQISEQKALEFIDPLEFGSDKDPCFGKLFDLTTEECSTCGDAVFCANRYKLRLLNRVEKEEANYEKVVDKELTSLNLEVATKYIKAKVEKGLKEELIVKLAKKRYKIPKKTILQIIKDS